MRRHPVLLTLFAMAMSVPLVACEAPGSSKQKVKTTTPERVPFEKTTPETKPRSTKAPKTTLPPTDGSSDTADPNAIEPSVVATTQSVPDTRGANDPLCKAATTIVSLNDQWQAVLAKALAAGNPTTLVKALHKLPVDAIRNAYDDLAAEVPTALLRRRVATIRDFTAKAGDELTKVKDIDALNQLVIDLEADPDGAAAVKAAITVSKYTDKECGVRISQGAAGSNG